MSKKQTEKTKKQKTSIIPDNVSEECRILWNIHEEWSEHIKEDIEKEVGIFLKHELASELLERYNEYSLPNKLGIETDFYSVYPKHNGKIYDFDIGGYFDFNSKYLQLLFMEELNRQWDKKLREDRDWYLLNNEKIKKNKPKKEEVGTGNTIGMFDDLFCDGEHEKLYPNN